jgi:hypothetical protein
MIAAPSLPLLSFVRVPQQGHVFLAKRGQGVRKLRTAQAGDNPQEAWKHWFLVPWSSGSLVLRLIYRPAGPC